VSLDIRGPLGSDESDGFVTKSDCHQRGYIGNRTILLR
jgi:hypothetical protein